MIVVYGLKNCDSVRKARQWLAGEGIAHRFHDFRADGLARAIVARWVAELGWPALVNRRSATWRKLDEVDRAIKDDAAAVALMTRHPALIKRPLFDLGSRRLVGFDQAVRDRLAETASAAP
jgi:Spx/MgsR family transcriptional regulator